MNNNNNRLKVITTAALLCCAVSTLNAATSCSNLNTVNLKTQEDCAQNNCAWVDNICYNLTDYVTLSKCTSDAETISKQMKYDYDNNIGSKIDGSAKFMNCSMKKWYMIDDNTTTFNANSKKCNATNAEKMNFSWSPGQINTFSC